jgi:hypothetical protein
MKVLGLLFFHFLGLGVPHLTSYISYTEDSHSMHIHIPRVFLNFGGHRVSQLREKEELTFLPPHRILEVVCGSLA